MTRFVFVVTGDTQIDRMLNELGKKSTMRKATVPAARAGLNAVLPIAKQMGKRTSDRGKSRPPVGSASGPMSRFVSVRAISAKARSIGAKLIYNVRRFPGFIVRNRAGKRFFYPAIQEYGTRKSRPPIPPKRQFEQAMQRGANAALTAFREKFMQVYPDVVAAVRRRTQARG